MSHFQERRTGSDRRQYAGEDRRKKSGRRDNSGTNLEFIDRERFKAWLVMTDKETQS